jgi:transcription antitermination factor NusG
VKIDEREHARITNVEGYINLVYWLKKPAVIRSEEIDAIKKFLDDHDQVHLEKVNVNLDDQVRIVGGPFMELEGKVVEIKSRTVKVLLPSLGFALVAELDKVNIQLIPQYRSGKYVS